MNVNLNIFPTSEALAQGAAEAIADILMEAIRDHGRAMVSLAGGSTPRKVYARIGSDPMRSDIPWEKVHLFWGDERCVMPNNPESNYRMVADSLLKHISIPQKNVHRVRAEENPVDAARQYEEEILGAFGTDDGFPRFDLVILGLGEDGHTASLFPGTPALDEKEKLVTDVFVDRSKGFRITMTLPLLNNARHVIVLVSGRGKATILAHVLRKDEHEYPILRIRPVSGDLRWLVDADAASQLNRKDLR